MLGCLLHVFDLVRCASLAKYLLARVRGGDPSDARRASEPEDWPRGAQKGSMQVDMIDVHIMTDVINIVTLMQHKAFDHRSSASLEWRLLRD